MERVSTVNTDMVVQQKKVCQSEGWPMRRLMDAKSVKKMQIFIQPSLRNYKYPDGLQQFQRHRPHGQGGIGGGRRRAAVRTMKCLMIAIRPFKVSDR